MKLGERIRILRTEAHLSLPVLAQKADISKSVLFQIETSESANPSLDTLQKIAKALGTTLAELLSTQGVRAKRQLPARLDPELEKMIAGLREDKSPINEAALDALYVLQERSGGSKTAADWRWLYDSIVLRLGKKQK